MKEIINNASWPQLIMFSMLHFSLAFIYWQRVKIKAMERRIKDLEMEVDILWK